MSVWMMTYYIYMAGWIPSFYAIKWAYESEGETPMLGNLFVGVIFWPMAVGVPLVYGLLRLLGFKAKM